MESRRFAEYPLSRMMLGTVQFGLDYGIANRLGKPDYSRVMAILAAALDGGVNCFDTAAAYGNSEDVLGQALRELGVLDRVVVVTKVRHLTEDERADPAAAKRAIEESVDGSRRRLGMDCLPAVLFHNEEDAVHLPALTALKDRGWLRHVGVSCGNLAGPAVRFAEQGDVEAMQLPANILDWRHEQSGAFAAAAETGTAAFVRSVFLQGLLVMPEQDIRSDLAEVLPVRRRLSAVAESADISLAELAVRAVLAVDGVTCVLTGVESVDQVRQNLEIFDRGPLDETTMAEVKAAVPELSEYVITPWMWHKT